VCRTTRESVNGVELTLAQGRFNGKGGLSARSVLYHHRILSEALSHAVKMGLAARNVAEVIDPPRPARVKMGSLARTISQDFLTLHVKRRTMYYIAYSCIAVCAAVLSARLWLEPAVTASAELRPSPGWECWCRWSRCPAGRSRSGPRSTGFTA